MKLIIATEMFDLKTLVVEVMGHCVVHGTSLKKVLKEGFASTERCLKNRYNFKISSMLLTTTTSQVSVSGSYAKYSDPERDLTYESTLSFSAMVKLEPGSRKDPCHKCKAGWPACFPAGHTCKLAAEFREKMAPIYAKADRECRAV